MKPLFAAIAFLTVIPVPKALAGDVDDLEKSVPFFPVVGLLLGILAAAFGYVMDVLLPVYPATVMVVIFLLALSGGLHMDGLADTADGFFSARPRERMLEIMKDSRIGVMGVLAVVCVMLLKLSLFVSLPLSMRLTVFFLTPLAGRCALVILMTALPYVRSTGGLATLFVKRRSWMHVLWVALFLALAGIFAAQWMGVAAAAATLAVAVLLAFYSYRKIGGYTGDTLGAVCEITEIVPALVVVCWVMGNS